MSPEEEVYTNRASMSEDELEFYRDAPEFPYEIDDFIQRPVSSRSVVRTPSSKYRDKNIIKKREDVRQQPQLPEEGVNGVDHIQLGPNVDEDPKTHVENGVSKLKGKGLVDQRSISSEICVSPSWSRAADKKRRKKDQKRQEREQRDLERKLEVQSQKNTGTTRREPRRLTKRPPPASSSRASSANSRMPRPSTASSFRSFWSNRSSRASSVQGSDNEGRKKVHILDSFKGDPKNGTWFPRMWPKKSKSKHPQQGDLASDSEGQPHNTPRRSLHTVKKHGDLRSMAGAFDKEDVDDRQVATADQVKKPDKIAEPSLGHDDRAVDSHKPSNKGGSYPLEQDPITQQSQISPSLKGIVIGPSSTKKRLPLAPTTQDSGKSHSTTPSRIPLASSRSANSKNPLSRLENRSITNDSLDKLPAVKLPQIPVQAIDRSAENAGQTPKKEDIAAEPRSPNISKKINRTSESRLNTKTDIKLSRNLFEGADHACHDEILTAQFNSPVKPQDSIRNAAQESSLAVGEVMAPVTSPASGSDTSRQGDKSQGTINFSRAARLRPSPLSEPPLLSLAPKEPAAGNNKITQESTEGPLQDITDATRQGRRPTLDYSAPARTRRLSLDRFLKPGRARKASVNETGVRSAEQVLIDSNFRQAGTGEPHSSSKDTLGTNVSANMASSKFRNGLRSVNAGQKDESLEAYSQKTRATDDAKQPKPRRNSMDIIQKFRPSLAKAEVKLKKKRPMSAGAPTGNASPEKAPTAKTRTSSASNSPLPSPGHVHPLRASFPASISTLKNMRDEGGNGYFTRPVGKPWIGSDQFPSSSSLLGFSSGSPGSSTRVNRPNSSGQRIAKMFVICCKCKFWHDMPSDAYAKLAFPTVAALKNKLAAGNVQKNKDTGEDIVAGWTMASEEPNSPSNTMSDEISRAGMDSIAHGSRDHSNFANNGKPPSPATSPRFSFLNQSVIKCCWCDHRMSRVCCAGWTAVVQLRERHH
ncbi:hypothetical protein FQN49_005009 [Arthroderma sp. PD_2]|nr:hypothetical protein FQN49_005009 [Arthroderma sp. PD_2]